MPKVIVWDLFGGGMNSVYNSIDKDKYEVYTFDITTPTRPLHFIEDLTVENIVETMSKYPKPDIIVASPLCQSWSIALQMKGGGTCFWKVENGKVVQRTIEEFERLKSGFTGHLNAKKQLAIAQLGQKCIDNTIKLIQHYKPKHFYIENPATSLIWKYITLNRRDFYKPEMSLNQTSYGYYGYPISKNTIFLSDCVLHLQNGAPKQDYEYFEENGIKYKRIKGTKNRTRVEHGGMCGLSSISGKGENSEATERSHIPYKLIQQIFHDFEVGEKQQTLF